MHRNLERSQWPKLKKIFIVQSIRIFFKYKSVLSIGQISVFLALKLKLTPKAIKSTALNTDKLNRKSKNTKEMKSIAQLE